jgi:hypothetical protein
MEDGFKYYGSESQGRASDTYNEYGKKWKDAK